MNASAPPPPLPRAQSSAAWIGAALAALGVVLAVVVARAAVAGPLPAPGCGFRRLCGLPCPGCGGTRSLSALGQFDLAGAFAWNPLVAAVAVLLLLTGVAALLDHRLAGGGLARRVGPRLSWGRRAWWALGAAVLVNWAYLVWRAL